MTAQIKNIFLLLIMLLPLISCDLSDEEIDLRQNNAFDISGKYETNLEDSDLEMTLFITNENGRHDILIELQRNGLTDKEKELFNSLNLDLFQIEESFDERFKLGQGPTNEFSGGENISDDLGETSSIYVNSKSLKLYNEYEITYSLNANISKNDYVLRGSLDTIITKPTITTDKDGISTYSSELISHMKQSFNAKTDSAYYRQYLGEWCGQIELNTSSHSNIQEIKSFSINLDGFDFFNLSAKKQSISFEGNSYVLVKNNFSIDDLVDYYTPAIEIEYRLNDDTSIFFFGNIYSLGNFSGPIILIDRNGEEVIGNFQFIKK